MSCCGSRRATFRQSPDSSPDVASASYRPLGSVEIEYTGHSQLSVTGPATGVVYRFSGHGQRRQVHGADVAGLRTVPSLRVLR